jgi:hypothetical protein
MESCGYVSRSVDEGEKMSMFGDHILYVLKTSAKEYIKCKG